ncbi:MAG: histidine kinase dimerization/phosphoacceptor domain -containing protein [Rhodospirillales bacterium]
MAALLGVWGWLASRTHGEAEIDAVAAASTSTRLAQENFLWTVRSVDLVLEMANRTLDQPNPAQTVNDPAKREEVNHLAQRLPYIGALWIIDDQGVVRYSTAQGMLDRSMVDRNYFQAHRNGAQSFISPRTTGRITGRDFFAISRRMDRDGKFAGVVLAAFDPAYFPAFGRSLGLHAGAEIAIVTSDGESIVGTGERHKNAIPALWSELKKNPIAGDFSSLRHTPSDGVDYLVAARPISEFGLTTLYVAPWSDLMVDWMRRFWIGSAIIALAVAVIVGGAALAGTFGRQQAYLRNVLGVRTAEATRSSERLELAIEATGIGIFDFDTRNRSLAWAGVGPGHFGLPAVEGLSPSRFMRHVHADDRLTLVRELRRLRSRDSDGAAMVEFRMYHPEAGLIWVAARGRLFASVTSGRAAHRIIGTIRDVTEQHLLQEHKDTVLREINHRIKNSLQLMNSIMNLQSRRIASAEERGRFEVARRRLVALATVYAHLDDTARPDSVELVSFLRRLCRDFSVAYMSDGRSALAFTGEGEVVVPTTQAVPLGMAVGEILVNLSLQSIENNAKGIVRVDVRVKGNGVEVRVIDADHIGSDAFAGAAGPLSSTLIHAFVDQIGGRLSTKQTETGTWLISFAANQSSGTRPAPSGSYLMAAERA